MPNNASSKKRLRQDEARSFRNKERRSRMRGTMRLVREAIEAGDKSRAQSLLPLAFSSIDKAAGKNVIHANNAANKKARLSRQIARM